MTSRHQKNLLILILGLAIGMRIALAIAHPFSFPDAKDYDALARALISGQQYQVNHLIATRMPGYPLLIAPFYFLFGPTAQPILIAQALFGGLTTLLVYLIAKRIAEPLALLAALLTALDPLSIGFSASLLSETPFTLFFLFALWLACRISESEKPKFTWWIYLGLSWSAAVYLRPSALWCIVPIVFLIAFKTPRDQRARAAAGATLTIALVLLSLLPWQARNYSYFHSRFFRLTTLEGISLYEAVYPGADGGPKQDIIPLPDEMRSLNEAQINDEWSRRAWQDIAADPARTLKLAGIKISRTWSPTLNATDFQNPSLRLVMLLWYIPLFIFAVIGATTPVLQTKLKLLLLTPILYFTLIHALFLGSVRYRVPLMPIVCIFAAAGIYSLLNHLKNRKPRLLSAV